MSERNVKNEEKQKLKEKWALCSQGDPTHTVWVQPELFKSFEARTVFWSIHQLSYSPLSISPSVFFSSHKVDKLCLLRGLPLITALRGNLESEVQQHSIFSLYSRTELAHSLSKLSLFLSSSADCKWIWTSGEALTLGSLGHLFGQLTCSLWTCSTLIRDELLSFFYGMLLSLSDFMVCWSHDGLFWMYGHLIPQGQMFHLLWDPVAWQKQFFEWFSALIAWPYSRILCVCVAVLLSGLPETPHGFFFDHRYL